MVVYVDVSREKDAEVLFQTAVEEFGKIDILINNAAGGYTPNAFQNISSEEWKTAEEGLSHPTFYMSQLF